MRYDLSNIMRTAWNIKRANGYTMSEALKRAWKKAKYDVATAEIAEREAKKAAKKAITEIKLVPWFEGKKFDATCRFLKRINKVVKETAKAVLLEVVIDYGSMEAVETEWVPKSCIVVA